MRSSSKYVVPVVGVSLLAALGLIFRSFFMTNIVEPIAILFWAIWRLIAGVDQNIYWAILITGCAILVVRLLPVGDKSSSNPMYNYHYPVPQRVEYWRKLINNLSDGNDQTEELRTSLTKLFQSVVEQTERSEPPSLDERLATSKAPLSATAKLFIIPDKHTSKLFSIAWLLGLAPRWLQKWLGKFIRPDVTAIHELLAWMEAEMEISNDK